MSDYETVELSSHCNAGVSLLGDGVNAPIGLRSFRGLPFLVGAAEADPTRCFVAMGHGHRTDPLRVPIGRQARRVLVAHRLLETSRLEGEPPGKLVAQYTVCFANGNAVSAPVRERFEIATIEYQLLGLPFGAVGDSKTSLAPRHGGRWDAVGGRQVEVTSPYAKWYFLWTWLNPSPEQEIAALEIKPCGPAFLLAGITLGLVEENPLVHPGAREVKVVLCDPTDASRIGDLSVEVDRGAATYPFALPAESAAEFVSGTMPGWGATQNPRQSPAYVRVAAVPSATVSIKSGEETLGDVRWGELEANGTAQPSPRVRLEVVDPGRNWVRTTVVDDATGRPLPCRIHFRSPVGVPYQPHGHPHHVNSNLGTWNWDVGGDLRLGQVTYAYIDGTCEGWLPRGDVLVDVACGFEYEPLRTRVRVDPGQQELVLRLRRLRDMNAAGWFSGDTHVHFLSTMGGHFEARGECLNVVNVLLSQWGHVFSNAEEFTGRPSVSPDGRTIVYACQENRQHLLGHLTLLGLKKPVMPWCSDGPAEAELGGTLEVTLADWADRCRAQGGTVVVPHIPAYASEWAALIATGRADALEIHEVDNTEGRGFKLDARHLHLEYYRYLNCGYQLPLVGGTDKMTADVPVGLHRTYAYVPADEGFSYESWCRSIRAGRTFVSGGPLLEFTVDGARIGDTLRLPGNGGTVEVVARAQSIFPIHRLEIVQAGRVVAATEEPEGGRDLRLQARLPVGGDTWFAARVGGPGYYRVTEHHDSWRRGVFAHTSPIYVTCQDAWHLVDGEALQYMLTLVDGSLSYIRELSPQYPPGTVTHHHGQDSHRAYLEGPFLEAREAIHRRMHALGLAH